MNGIPAAASDASTAAKCSRHAPHRESRIDGASAVARMHRSDLQSRTRSGFRILRRRQSSHRSASRPARNSVSRSLNPGRHSGSPSELISSDMPREPRVPEEPVQEGHRLGVGVGGFGPEQLRAELVELPEAPLLRALVAEHRADVEQADRPLPDLGPVLQDRADHRGGPLGPHRQAVARPVGEGVHLLLDDVGRLADRAREQLRPLEQRRPDLAEAVPAGMRPERRLERGPT